MVVQKRTEEIASATVRFAGDSGDGMQLAGMQFTDTSALFGNDIATLPDFPAEIRAPIGTVAGVSGFQINFASSEIFTPGDAVDALIAMNPAAFKANVGDVRSGGIVIANESEFTKINLRKAGYEEGYNPLEDEAVQAKVQLYCVPITRLTEESLTDTGLGAKQVTRSKNMYALGLIYWFYGRPLDPTIKYLNDYFGEEKNLPQVAEVNVRALQAGYAFGETAELFPVRYHVGRAPIEKGTYRRITGNEAMAMGLIAAAHQSGKTLIYSGYPITPASEILHYLAKMKQFGVKTFQAEDEIAAMSATVGAAFAGQLAVTASAGPGIALKGEAMGLAVMVELPLIIIDVQRGGPSTGLPTKTEQSDLMQAMFGRHGDSPLVVVAPRSPSDCFDTAMQAVKVAFESMVPVMILSDGYIANGAEPWRIPEIETLPSIEVHHPGPITAESDNGDFEPYARNGNLARPWAVPGTEGLEHRLGGLEKEDVTGDVSYDPANHQRMTELRRRKVELVADRLPPTEIHGDDRGELLIVGWGGTYGSIVTAVDRAHAAGKKVSAVHLRWLSPLPNDLGDILKGFDKVLVPELNMGQLRMILRAKYLVDARGLNKVHGQPFLIEELTQAIDLMLDGSWGDAESISPHDHAVTV